MEILNLDLFEEDFKEIKLKGKTYKVPSDIPVILFFELMEANKGGDISNMQKGIGILYKIFLLHNPDLEYSEFASAISIAKYTAIINYIFADVPAEETMKIFNEAKEQLKEGKKKPLPVEN